MIHMQRNYNEGDNSSLPLFEGWTIKMYYDISVEPISIVNNMELIKDNIIDIIKRDHILEFYRVIGDLTEKCLLTLTQKEDSPFD